MKFNFELQVEVKDAAKVQASCETIRNIQGRDQLDTLKDEVEAVLLWICDETKVTPFTVADCGLAILDVGIHELVWEDDPKAAQEARLLEMDRDFDQYLDDCGYVKVLRRCAKVWSASGIRQEGPVATLRDFMVEYQKPMADRMAEQINKIMWHADVNADVRKACEALLKEHKEKKSC